MSSFRILRFPVGLAVALAAAPAGLTGQLPGSSQPSDGATPYSHPSDAPIVHAHRTSERIVVDGVLDEPAWLSATPLTEMTQIMPDEGEPATQTTEVRFLYDDDNLYVAGRLRDSGEMITRRARRDASVPDTDVFAVYLDTQHDHRTAYRFATNPSALKKDEIITGERGGPLGSSDLSWDPIWEVRTSVSEEGWQVEMRIPFSQLRYGVEDVQTWGLQIERKIRRLNEESYWAFTPRRERGGVARMGHLEGIRGIAGGKRLEVLPFLSGRAEYARIPRAEGALVENPFRTGSDHFGQAGVDVKYRLTSNFTLDGTINPDFGQVELDPAVINLTAFETRFDEKRPFFVEGAEIFRFGEGSPRPGPMNPQILYSRRIGRTPQGEVPGAAIYSEMPQSTAILGAMKVTGRTAEGWSVGALNVVTREERVSFLDASGIRGVSPVEPLSNYFAGRVRRDFRSGAGSIGVIGTTVNRELDDPSLDSRLRSAAYGAGVDARLEWDNRAWLLAGELTQSHVRGSAEAMGRTQRASARYFQRPDAEHLDYDPAATSLSGLFGSAELSKRAGEWQGKLAVVGITPGYEVNDLGFQVAADRFFTDLEFGYEQTRPGRHTRNWGVRLAPSGSWNLAGDPQSLAASLSGSGQLRSFHSFSWRVERQIEAYDDRLTRGGIMARVPAGHALSIGGGTDSRGPVQIRGKVDRSADDAGGWNNAVGLNLAIRLAQIYDIQIGPQVSRSRTAAQYVATVADPLAERTLGRRYIFAPLQQTTVSLQLRVNATFTQDLSLEIYAQPLISSGDYGPPMELSRPRSFEFVRYEESGSLQRGADGHWLVDPDGAGPAGSFRASDLSFNKSSLLGNAVLRWEWRPGSTLFLVWQQSRLEDRTTGLGDSAFRRVGTFDFDQDAGGLFGLKPNNIFLVKVNYWLNP